MSRTIKDALLGLEAVGYSLTVRALYPINWLLAVALASRVNRRSVLHVSGMVHVAFHTVRLLREHGVNADYLAIQTSPWWDQADHCFKPTRIPLVSVLKEMWWVWTLVSRYEIVHAHFMAGVSRSGWEWPLLRRMGRHIVVHYRGCDIRERSRNMALHPEMNICEECDYTPYICAVNAPRRRVATAQGSAFLVTTPDLKDFAPQAVHLPFFITRPAPVLARTREAGHVFKIVHATNHPGIEGSRHIRAAIESLRQKGHAIEYVELRGVTHERVMAELADADLTIGKMKMGYYANFQVESLAAGVPAVTHVRDAFVTDAIRQSGLVLATLSNLESTLERLLTHPEELAAKRAVARESAAALHDPAVIATQMIGLYERLLASPKAGA